MAAKTAITTTCIVRFVTSCSLSQKRYLRCAVKHRWLRISCESRRALLGFDQREDERHGQENGDGEDRPERLEALRRRQVGPEDVDQHTREERAEDEPD